MGMVSFSLNPDDTDVVVEARCINGEVWLRERDPGNGAWSTFWKPWPTWKQQNGSINDVTLVIIAGKLWLLMCHNAYGVFWRSIRTTGSGNWPNPSSW